MQQQLLAVLGVSIGVTALLIPNSTLSANESAAVGTLVQTQLTSEEEPVAISASSNRTREATPQRRERQLAAMTLASSKKQPPAEGVSPQFTSEKSRLVACAGHMNGATHHHVKEILQRRLTHSNSTKAGMNRFIVVGASASRAREFLTGFAYRDRYTLSATWKFLQPTIDWFSSRTSSRNSFARKRATVSGTTAGNWVWKQAFCLDCPEKLTSEIRSLSPAFALVMFGTNNVSWGGRPGYKGYFKKWIAAGFNDKRCRREGLCLPPYELGNVTYPDPRSERALPQYVHTVMHAKRRTFRIGYKALLESLLSRDIVPIISTIPPMPRRWLDEDTVVAMNEEIRSLASEYRIPMIDLWCALNPIDEHGRQDWTHPIMANNKGIAGDRYHPQSRHAFHVADENLIYGYLVRNVLTLLRLGEMRDLALQLLHTETAALDTVAIQQ